MGDVAEHLHRHRVGDLNGRCRSPHGDLSMAQISLGAVAVS